jgi:hypothetical protein
MVLAIKLDLEMATGVVFMLNPLKKQNVGFD